LVLILLIEIDEMEDEGLMIEFEIKLFDKVDERYPLLILIPLFKYKLFTIVGSIHKIEFDSIFNNQLISILFDE
jgi:hypothetical protein